MVVYSPELMFNGPLVYTAFRIITAFFAIAAMSMAFLGYLGGNLGIIARLIVLLSGLLMVPNHLILNMVGYAVLLGILYREKVYPLIGIRGASKSPQEGKDG